MPTVSFHTLGCKLNYAETSTVARQFAENCYDIVPFGEPSDVTVINTCSVTDEADRKCRQTIRRAVRVNQGTFVIVTGCYAQLKPDDIAAIPGVDAVLGTGEKFSIFELLDSFSAPEATQVHVSCIDDATRFGPAFSTGERTRAFLKVQDGCDYSCSFCTIPLARGHSRSQSIADTVSQARDIAARGHREVVLSGVNIGLFGADTGESLLSLLRELDGVDGIDRFRISSIEPNLLSDSIIDFVGESRRFMPHFHVPLQSGDDFVLGKMRRRYRRDLYARRVNRVKALMPDAGFGADVIVGFPAESSDRFETTRAFIADLPITYLHVFTYSERSGTAAETDPARAGGPAIPREERSRRNRQLRALSSRMQSGFSRSCIGGKRPVLWEGKVDGGRAFGYTDNYIRVSAPMGDVRIGEVEDIVLAELLDDGTVLAKHPAYVPIL